MGLPSTQEDIDQKVSENLSPDAVARAAKIQADPIGPKVLKSHADRIDLEDNARSVAVAEGLAKWRKSSEIAGKSTGLWARMDEEKRLRKEFDKRSTGWNPR